MSGVLSGERVVGCLEILIYWRVFVRMVCRERLLDIVEGILFLVFNKYVVFLIFIYLVRIEFLYDIYRDGCLLKVCCCFIYFDFIEF